MIKRYNQFVKGKVNEKFAMDEPPMDEPSMDSMDEPSMEQDSMEEEGGEYMGTQKLQNLADSLGTEVVDNSVEYNGKKVNFYSETEMFHVDKKKFKTVEEVVDYLEGGAFEHGLDGEKSKLTSDNKSMEEENVAMLARQEHSPSKEDMDELMNAHDDDDFIDDEEEFESKSYKSTRKFESYKNKNK
jgi:hypothetical protein